MPTPIKSGLVLRRCNSSVKIGVFILDIEGMVGSICGEVDKEGFVCRHIPLCFSLFVAFDELNRLREPDICAVSLEFLRLAVHKVCVIKVVCAKETR